MTEPHPDAWSVSICPGEADSAITMTAPLFLRFLKNASDAHARGLKSFGLFFSEAKGDPRRPTEFHFCDASKNRRNDHENRRAFEAQGEYFRRFDDAGFVADSAEIFRVHERARARGVEPVGVFHTHRRQPANFSSVDYRLHSPFYAWHLVLSLRDPMRPAAQAFFVDKPFDTYGLDAEHVVADEGELPHAGPEVRAARLVVTGSEHDVTQVRTAMWREAYRASSACQWGVP